MSLENELIAIARKAKEQEQLVSTIGVAADKVRNENLALVETKRVNEFKLAELEKKVTDLTSVIAVLRHSEESANKLVDIALAAIKEGSEDATNTMLRAVEAGVIAHIGPTRHVERQAFLRHRGWIRESESSWRHVDSGRSLPYEACVKTQVEADLRPFMGK